MSLVILLGEFSFLIKGVKVFLQKKDNSLAYLAKIHIEFNYIHRKLVFTIVNITIVAIL